VGGSLIQLLDLLPRRGQFLFQFGFPLPQPFQFADGSAAAAMKAIAAAEAATPSGSAARTQPRTPAGTRPLSQRSSSIFAWHDPPPSFVV
jgi:hypothetical protein